MEEEKTKAPKEVKVPKVVSVIGEVASVDSKETHVGTEIVRKVTFIVGGNFKPGEKYEFKKV